MVKNRDTQVERKGMFLEGKRICVCVTGSIAAVESVKLIRELRRFGADVFVAVSLEAQKFITPLSLEWASSHPLLSHNSGRAEHLLPFDMYIVAPATLNTINKFSYGLADNFVLSLLASAWGRGDIIYFIPAMHEDLFKNPIFQENLKKLNSYKNIRFSSFKESAENKIKFLDFEHIVADACHFMNIKNMRVLMTAGPTRAYVDSVRYIQNKSSGKLGSVLADHFYRSGIHVVVVYGPGMQPFKPWIETFNIESAFEMKQVLLSLREKNNYDAAILSAAVLDFKPENILLEKKSSKKPWDIRLVPEEKIIDQVQGLFKIGFKLETHISEIDLLCKASEWAKVRNIDVVVANRLEDISHNYHKATILHGDSLKQVSTREEIAHTLMNILLEHKTPHANVHEQPNNNE